MRIKSCKKGLTLVEVIISLAILGIIIAPIYAMTISTVKINKMSDDKQRALVIAQEYMEYIKSPIHTLEDIASLDNVSDGIINNEIIKDGFIVRGVKPTPSNLTNDFKEEFDKQSANADITVKTVEENGTKYEYLNIDSKVQGSFNGGKNNEISGSTLTIDCAEKDNSHISLSFKTSVDHGFIQYNIKTELIGDSIILKLNLEGSSITNLQLNNSYTDKQFKVYVYPSDISFEINENGTGVNYKDSTEVNSFYSNSSKKYNIYRVTIKVWKEGQDTGEPLQTLDGYKVISY